MKSYIVPVFATAAFAVACGAMDNPNVAAKAGDQELTVPRLAEILGKSQAPLEKDVARTIAQLWVNYQLLGMAAAANDSLNDPKVLDHALWSMLDNIRVRKLYDQVSAGWDTMAPGTDEARYAQGEALMARHILVRVDESATPEQRQAARRKAEQIRAQATPQNFAALAKQSDDPSGPEAGGDLGLFIRGMMVPEFEKAVLALEPGEISPVVETQFGYHVIYRTPYAEAASTFGPYAKQRNVAIAESTYLSKVEAAHDIKMTSNVGVKAKAIARDPLGYRDDKSELASYKGGKLTSAEFADWVGAYPPQSQLSGKLMAAPDSVVEQFVRQIVRNELILMQADSAKMQVDSAEKANLYMTFANSLTQTWTQLGVGPSQLTDSAKIANSTTQAVAVAKVEDYFNKLVNNEAQFVEVPYPIARALQNKYSFSINDSGLDRVVEQARTVRGSADSARTQQPPMGGDTALTTPPPPPGN